MSERTPVRFAKCSNKLLRRSPVDQSDQGVCSFLQPFASPAEGPRSVEISVNFPRVRYTFIFEVIEKGNCFQTLWVWASNVCYFFALTVMR